MARVLHPTPHELRLISQRLTSVYDDAYAEIDASLAAIGDGFAKASPWREAHRRQSLAQLRLLIRQQEDAAREQFTLLDDATAKWVNANVPALAGKGAAVIDGFLAPGGESKAAHKGLVTQMDLGMTRVSREAVEAVSESFVRHLSYANGKCARDAEDLFRAAQLNATEASFARSERSVLTTRRLQEQIDIRAAAMRARIDALKAEGRAPKAILETLREEGHVSERMLTGLERMGLRTPTQIADHLAKRSPLVFVDKAGRRWDMPSYVNMAASTTARDAVMAGADAQAEEFGQDVFRVPDNAEECDLCKPWEGKLFSLTGATPGLPTKADLRAAGLWHPRCEHYSYEPVEPEEVQAEQSSRTAEDIGETGRPMLRHASFGSYEEIPREDMMPLTQATKERNKGIRNGIEDKRRGEDIDPPPVDPWSEGYRIGTMIEQYGVGSVKDLPIVRGWRFGDIPAHGTSYNYRDSRTEPGVSMAGLIGGDKTWGVFQSDRRVVWVEGYLSPGVGSDGEPLVIVNHVIREDEDLRRLRMSVERDAVT